MGRLLIGVTSWAEQGLVKSGFYPPEVKTPAARLNFYSSRFPVAEIDASFHFFTTLRNMTLCPAQSSKYQATSNKQAPITKIRTENNVKKVIGGNPAHVTYWISGVLASRGVF